MSALVDNFANASKRLTVDRPEPLRARRHPRQPLVRPGAAARESRDAVIDLMPYTGLVSSMTGAEIKAIQAPNAAARKLASG